MRVHSCFVSITHDINLRKHNNGGAVGWKSYNNITLSNGTFCTHFSQHYFDNEII